MATHTLPAGWNEESRGLTRTFIWKSFPQAVAFTVEVGRLAENVQHHPDIDLRWNKVQLLLVTHDANSTITDKDYALARQINEISLEQVGKQAAALF